MAYKANEPTTLISERIIIILQVGPFIPPWPATWNGPKQRVGCWKGFGHTLKNFEVWRNKRRQCRNHQTPASLYTGSCIELNSNDTINKIIISILPQWKWNILGEICAGSVVWLAQGRTTKSWLKLILQQSCRPPTVHICKIVNSFC